MDMFLSASVSVWLCFGRTRISLHYWVCCCGVFLFFSCNLCLFVGFPRFTTLLAHHYFFSLTPHSEFNFLKCVP